MSGFDGNGWAPAVSVSAEDREKAAQAVADAADSAWGVLSSKPPMDQDYLAVDALIAAGWGPGGVSARPDRESLIAAIRQWGDRDPDLSDHRDETEKLADALLAVEHLWTQPAGQTVEAGDNRQTGTTPERQDTHGPASTPVVDPKALAKAIFLSDNWGDPNAEKKWDALESPPWEYDRARRRATFLLNTGVVQDRATVEREARIEGAQAVIEDWRHSSRLWMPEAIQAAEDVIARFRAEYREGRR